MISKKTKYGLKALSCIARRYQEQNKIIPISSISEEESIPRKFLESILLELRKAGFLGSQKGKSGGYYMLKQPSEISIASIYRILEGPIAPVSCVSLNFYEKCNDCKSEGACSVYDLMIQIRDASLNIYNNHTIADLIK